MEKENYTNKGVCIWCKKSKDDVSFNNEPHIAPKALGCNKIGFDICDSCNHYFGTANKGEPNTNLVFKEIFKFIQLFTYERTADTWKHLKSTYFKYEHSSGLITIKGTFRFSHRVMTKQFKRGICEIFLQKYHFDTSNGLDQQFDEIREYARYGKGDCKIYYVQKDAHLLSQDISKSIFFGVDLISDYGYYILNFNDFDFIIEANKTRATLMKDIFFANYKQHIVNNLAIRKCFVLDDIMQFDFFK